LEVTQPVTIGTGQEAVSQAHLTQPAFASSRVVPLLFAVNMK